MTFQNRKLDNNFRPSDLLPPKYLILQQPVNFNENVALFYIRCPSCSNPGSNLCLRISWPDHQATPRWEMNPLPQSVLQLRHFWNSSFRRQPECVFCRGPNHLNWLVSMLRSSDSILMLFWIIKLQLVPKDRSKHCGESSFQPLLFVIAFSESLPVAHDHSWGLERRLFGKLRTFPFGLLFQSNTLNTADNALINQFSREQNSQDTYTIPFYS